MNRDKNNTSPQAILDEDVQRQQNEELDELDKLLPESTIIKDIRGNDIAVPIVSWKREIQILRALSSLLAAVPPEVFKVELDKKEKRIPGAAVKKFAEQFPAILQAIATEERLQDLTKIAAEILDKEPSWVEDNLASPQIVELIIPFLLKRLTELTQRLPDATEFALGDLMSKVQV